MRGRQTINSVARNTLSLELTIADAIRRHCIVPYVQHLQEFLARVKESCDNPEFSFRAPSIKPEVKKVNGETICRPIARYQILDKVLIGQTNKYLTG